MTMYADPADKTEMFEFSGPRGLARSPDTPLDFRASFASALAALIAQAEGRVEKASTAYSTRANVVLTGVLATIDGLTRDGTVGVSVPVDEVLPPGP